MISMNKTDYQKIMTDAVGKEERSYRFYRAVSEKVADEALRTIFNDLAGDEMKHKEQLQSLMATGGGALHFEEKKSYRVTDDPNEPELTVDMKPLDGIRLAIGKELHSMQMYTALADASTDAGQRELFRELATMEKGHKARLEDIYTNMAFPEIW